MFGNASGSTARGVISVGSGGKTFAATLNSGAIETVLASGYASGTVVNSGGTLSVAGVTTGTVINSGGTEDVTAGGVATSTTDNWNQTVETGGSAVSATITSGAAQTVLFAGLASATQVASSGVQLILSGGIGYLATVANGGNAFVAGSGIGNMVGNGGTETVVSGGSERAGTVLSGGSLIVSSGGLMDSETISNGGSAFVAAVGSATRTVIFQGGTETVAGSTNQDALAGGTEIVSGSTALAAFTSVGDSGDLIVSAGAFAGSGTVYSGGAVDAFASGASFRTTVESGGNAVAHAGGFIEQSNLYGREVVSSGGVDSGTNILASGHLFVYSGGFAENDVVYAGGTEVVSAGGTVDGTTISSGGTEVVSSGGILVGSTVVSAGGTLQIAVGALFEGAQASVTLAAGGVLDVEAGQTLDLDNIPLSNAGTFRINGNAYAGALALVRVGGTVSLSGGGVVTLADVSGASAVNTQGFTGRGATDLLDNVDNTIDGTGFIGGGTMSLRNEIAGLIEGIGAGLSIDTGAGSFVNAGIAQAVAGALEIASAVTNSGTLAAAPGGVLLLRGAVANTGLLTAFGGSATLRALVTGPGMANVSSSGTLVVNGGGLSGGSLAVDSSSNVQAISNGGTFASLGISNAGTIALSGNAYSSLNTTLHIGGTVDLNGIGALQLSDASGAGAATTQVITGGVAADTLRNFDETISGYGQIGQGTLTLFNGAGGTIEGTGVSGLTIDTTAGSFTNRGTLAGYGGTLTILSALANSGTVEATGLGGATFLRGAVASTGTLQASSSGTLTLQTIVTQTGTGSTGVGFGGALVLDGGGLSGSTLANSSAGHVSFINTGGTLDSLSVANAGTIAITGNAYSSINTTLHISGTVELDGSGALQLYDVSGANAAPTQVIVGGAASDTLANIGNVIGGFGALGHGTLSLLNGASGTIEGTGVSGLTIDTGAGTFTNRGLLEGRIGSLIVASPFANSGTIAAITGGTALIKGAVASTGVLQTTTGGTLTLQALVTGTTDQASVGANSLLVFDGGGLRGGTLAIAAAGSAFAQSHGGTLTSVSVINAGTFALRGNAYSSLSTMLNIGGTVSLSGSGSLTLNDTSGAGAGSTQVITGSTAGDVLENVDNTITGYGDIGSGQMTLINRAAGTIVSTGNILTLDTGLSIISNYGLLEGLGGTLKVASGVFNAGTIFAGAAGNVLLQGSGPNSGLVSASGGGTITVGGLLTNQGGQISAGNGGALALDGGGFSSGTVSTAAAGLLEIVSHGGTLAALSVANAGTLAVRGNAYSGLNTVLYVAGTVSLAGGGAVTLSDTSGANGTGSQGIAGASASDTLDNLDNTIRGYGGIGGGLLTLVNAAAGTIDSTVSGLVLDTGTSTIFNAGLLEAHAALAVKSNLFNGGTVLAAGGGVTVASTNDVTNNVFGTLTGGTWLANAASIDLGAGTVDTIAANVSLAGGSLRAGGLDLSQTLQTVAAGGTFQLSGASMTLASTTLTDNGLLSIGAGGTLTVSNVVVGPTGSIVLDGGSLLTDPITVTSGGTIAGHGTITGAVTLNGVLGANSGSLALTGAVTGAGVLSIGAGSALRLGAAAVGVTLSFDPSGGGSLVLAAPDSFQGAIANFASTDALIVAGLTGATATTTTSGGTTTLTFSRNGTQVGSLAFSGGTDPSALAFDPSSGQVTSTQPSACYARGTRILTERGEVAVERLAVGDLLPTVDGAAAPVVWIGRRRIDLCGHPQADAVRPVLVEAHAFGPGLPHRDLVLSPDHAVFVEGVLIPIRCLADGARIRPLAMASVEYFHVELPEHAVILAEGLPAESWLDTGNRHVFANGGVAAMLHPVFAPAGGYARACHRLAVDGAEVEAARARIRAGCGSRARPVASRAAAR